MGRVGAAIACLLGCVGAVCLAAPPEPPATPDALLSHAQTVRTEAEDALAAARKQRLDERSALAARIQSLYAELDAARAEADAASADARAAEDQMRRAVAERESAESRLTSLTRQASRAAGVELAPGLPAAQVEAAVGRRLDERLAALRDAGAVTAAAEAVVGRAGAEAGTPVLRLGAFAAYACGDSEATCGLLKRGPDGRLLVAGPLMRPAQADLLAEAVRAGGGDVPVDVSGALAERAPVAARTVAGWLGAGGLFVYPILAVGVLGLVLTAERMLYLLRSGTRAGLVHDVVARLESGDVTGALRLAEGRSPTARVLRAGVDAAKRPEQERDAAMESALLAEAPRLERSLSMLAALASVAPLLGLLGTVSGMIATFNTIAAAGTGNPRLLSGGISEALITTQLGLMVAIPLFLVHAWLSRWVERREARLEYEAVQVFGLGPEGGEGGA